jgi:hypothetical protein
MRIAAELAAYYSLAVSVSPIGNLMAGNRHHYQFGQASFRAVHGPCL